MIATAGKIFSKPEDIEVAEKIVKGCLWAYDSMPTGMMPETFHVVPCTDPDCTWNETAWREAVYQRHQDWSEIESMSKEDFVDKVITADRLKPGFSAIGDRRYILR
jgi:mannosyl-oligosaccharide alpha-1,2-mannosidase